MGLWASEFLQMMQVLKDVRPVEKVTGSFIRHAVLVAHIPQHYGAGRETVIFIAYYTHNAAVYECVSSDNTV
jgi:hypothetical protein